MLHACGLPEYFVRVSRLGQRPYSTLPNDTSELGLCDISVEGKLIAGVFLRHGLKWGTLRCEK